MDEGTRGVDGSGATGADLDDLVLRLSSIVVGERPPEDALREVASLAKQVLPGVLDVSLTVVDRGRPRTVVFTGPLAVQLDERQYEEGFGPCLDAARSGQVITVDAGEETSSPYAAFATLAARSGVRQTIAMGLPVGDRTIGGLNFYRSDAGPVPEAIEHQLRAFVGSAAAVVNNLDSYARATAETAQLRLAMDSRAVIEQAKGVLMAREHCSADEAFALLTRVSQHQQLKLRDVAAAVVADVSRSSTRDDPS